MELWVLCLVTNVIGIMGGLLIGYSNGRLSRIQEYEKQLNEMEMGIEKNRKQTWEDGDEWKNQ